MDLQGRNPDPGTGKDIDLCTDRDQVLVEDRDTV